MTASTRIAVCSSDGRMVDEHFGTATQFLILDVDSDSVRFTEWRENTPACHAGNTEHAGSPMQRSIELVSDCQLVLAVRVGPPVISKLAARGIEVRQTSQSIAEAVEALRAQAFHGLTRVIGSTRGSE
jgi:predicted Fe-Mo cluster-binding NifX family protein